MEFILPARARHDDCHRLAKFLETHAKTPVAVCADNVELLGGQAAQLLLVHAIARQKSDAPLQITSASEGLMASLATLDLQEMFKKTGALA